MEKKDRLYFATICQDESGRWHINYCQGAPFISRASNMVFDTSQKAVELVKRQATKFTPVIYVHP